MLGLRPYKKCDAEKIVSWCRDEKIFNYWGGYRFGTFPVTADVMNDKYFGNNGDCVEEDNFYPVTAFDETGVVGHFIMRYVNGDRKQLRFGWVIVDDSKRGQKIGQNMLRLGFKMAFDIMQVRSVTIGVFEENTAAMKCYLTAGFEVNEEEEPVYEEIDGRKMKIIELIKKR